jgi:hypothetical protein
MADLWGGRMTSNERWVQLPLSRERLDTRVMVGPGLAAAMGLYPAHGMPRRILRGIRHALVGTRMARRSAAPVADLRGICAYLGVEVDSIMARRSRPGRRTIAVASDGALRLVLKIGGLADPGLRREAAMLFNLGVDGRAAFVPELKWAGKWDGRFLIATAAVEGANRPRDLVPQGLYELCVALAQGGPWGGSVVHGDLAPWNVVAAPGRLVLLDWEYSRYGVEPMRDLTHFVLTQASTVRGISPRDAVATLTAPGSVGWRYLETLDHDPKEACDLVRGLLEQERDHFRMRRPMLRVLEGDR